MVVITVKCVTLVNQNLFSGKPTRGGTVYQQRLSNFLSQEKDPA